MIIGDNNPSRDFSNQHRPMNKQNPNMNQNPLGNNFENRWNQIKEYNNQRPQQQRNVFVKDIKEQHYADSSNTKEMHDRTLALLHDRLQQGTISLEEFNKQCAQLSKMKR